MVHAYPGLEVVFDGPDLAGKDALLYAIAEFERINGHKVYDLHAYWKQHKEHPEILDSTGELAKKFAQADVFLSSEPSFAGVGLVVRDEIIKKSHNRYYSALTTAVGYDMDRQILRSTVIHPLLAAGKTVLQSRSVSTTLAYQPLMVQQAKERALKLGYNPKPGNDVTTERLLHMPGNKQAMEHFADMLILSQIRDAKILLARMDRRAKNDDAIFENYAFLQKVNDIFTSKKYRELFTSRQVMVRYTDGAAHKNKETSVQMAIHETLGHYIELLTLRGRLQDYRKKDIEALSILITKKYFAQQ